MVSSFGPPLRRLRQESGLTIEELSHAMDSALLTALRAHPIGQALGRTQATEVRAEFEKLVSTVSDPLGG
ncbi:hypothetical protein [Nonomuraea bangladeshensis]|uniref:hypothetical protein n=1 Tax=Nonomuraea bangladeshensis TaxID=404385 RepID=UPI003C2C606D